MIKYRYYKEGTLDANSIEEAMELAGDGANVWADCEGLEMYNNSEPSKNVFLNRIVVKDEYSKQQLLLASEYIHNLHELDTDYMAVNVLAHLYEDPDMIIVED